MMLISVPKFTARQSAALAPITPEQRVDASMRSRPRLALVLGSGGVRSIAALGMVEVLAREGLHPDLIVGSSAGALFGALVAAGYEATQGVALAQKLWSPEVTQQRRWWAVPQMVWPRPLRFTSDFGLRRDELIMQRLHHVFGEVSIEQLPTALRITATDTQKGQPVVLERGPLVQALRASIALPFMFSSVQFEGQRLNDGFLTDPLPVSAASDAQAVVALGFESPMPNRIDGPARMLAQVTATMINNLMQARLAQARGEGLRLLAIVPKLERRVGLIDTAAMSYLVAEGRKAAEQHLDQIHQLLVAPELPSTGLIARAAA